LRIHLFTISRKFTLEFPVKLIDVLYRLIIVKMPQYRHTKFSIVLSTLEIMQDCHCDTHTPLVVCGYPSKWCFLLDWILLPRLKYAEGCIFDDE